MNNTNKAKMKDTNNLSKKCLHQIPCISILTYHAAFDKAITSFCSIETNLDHLVLTQPMFPGHHLKIF